MWRGDIIGRDASSEVGAAGSISASAASGKAGSREPGGRAGTLGSLSFPGLWPWPWPGASKGSDRHYSQREGTKTLPPLARPSSLVLYGIRKALSLLPPNPPRPSPISRALPRQAGLSALAIDRICIDVAALLQVSFCRPCFLAIVASPRGCFVSLRGRRGTVTPAPFLSRFASVDRRMKVPGV